MCSRIGALANQAYQSTFGAALVQAGDGADAHWHQRQAGNEASEEAERRGQAMGFRPIRAKHANHLRAVGGGLE